MTDGANVEAVHELGLILERSNPTGEVRALIDGAVAAGADPWNFALLEALLAWRDLKPHDALSWLTKADATREPVRVRQLEAKAHDRLGNSQAAFEAATAMNRAVRDYEQWRQRGAVFRRGLRKFSEQITPGWSASWKPACPGLHRAPVFLVGFPRSGTTLLYTFLMGHPDMAVIEEVPTLGLIADQIGSVARISELDEVHIEQLRTFYVDRMNQVVPDFRERLVIDKLPLNMLNAPLIYRLFPDARIIFAQRHPCDCVLSGFFQSFAMNPAMACFLNIGDAAGLYDVAMDVWTHSKSALPLDVHCIAYEKMVEQPERELRDVIAFLGLDWHPGVLDHRSTAWERGTIGTPSYDQITSPITTRSIGRWRRYEAQLRPALPLLLPWAARLGYHE